MNPPTTPADPVHGPFPDLPTDRRALLAGIGGLAAGALMAGRAQAGPLTPPPGPIAPTPGPEPRIAINATNTPGDAATLFRITQPGSYYLTGDITGVAGRNGIEIASSRVTLDLMGFALIGVTGSVNGIIMNSFRESVVIRNGHVFDWTGNGMRIRIDHGALEGVHCHSNGGWAIDNQAAFSFRIIGCSAFSNGTPGSPFGGISVGAMTTVTDCQMRSNIGPGIVLERGSCVTGCIAAENTDVGILATNQSLITNCVTSANLRHGIQVSDSCCVLNNMCTANGIGSGNGAGIHIAGTDNRVEGNNCSTNRTGIECVSSGNFIARNTCSGSPNLNWSVAANNKCLVINGVNAAAISGNAGGLSPGSVDPNANYTY